MRIANTINDSIVDGVGLRFTIFTQGCYHKCKGCHNQHTHDINGGKEVSIEELFDEIKNNPLIEGITLSGGEPFLQARECAKLARICHIIGLNVWTYTGYLFEDIISSNNKDWLYLLKETDVLVDGPFDIDQKSYETKFRGSKNQRLINVKRSLGSNKIVLYEVHDNILDKFTVPES